MKCSKIFLLFSTIQRRQLLFFKKIKYYEIDQVIFIASGSSFVAIGHSLDPNGNYNLPFQHLYHSDLQRLFCVSATATYISACCVKRVKIQMCSPKLYYFVSSIFHAPVNMFDYSQNAAIVAIVPSSVMTSLLEMVLNFPQPATSTENQLTLV